MFNLLFCSIIGNVFWVEEIAKEKGHGVLFQYDVGKLLINIVTVFKQNDSLLNTYFNISIHYLAFKCSSYYNNFWQLSEFE